MPWKVIPIVASSTKVRCSGSARATAHQAIGGTSGSVTVKTRLSAAEGTPAKAAIQ
jgi:hypothetical protein